MTAPSARAELRRAIKAHALAVAVEHVEWAVSQRTKAVELGRAMGLRYQNPTWSQIVQNLARRWEMMELRKLGMV